MEFTPIGFVKNQITSKNPKDLKYKDVISEIRIDEKVKDGLKKIDEFSHIIITYVFNLIIDDDRKLLERHPRNRPDLPLVGVFATRSPLRPNPLGITVVKLLKCDANTLTVMGLDAFNGSPVIDIKPYIPNGDFIANSIVPEWVKKL